MAHEEQGPMEHLLNGLDEQSRALSSDELREELRGRGIDIDPFLSHIDKMIADRDRQERLQWMRVADEKRAMLQAGKTNPMQWVNRAREEILAAFTALSTSEGIAVAFRNKERLSIEDMAEILESRDRLERASNQKGGE